MIIPQKVNIDEEMQEKQLHNTFRFKCVKGCYACCSMNDIALYPFDIMVLCNYLGISSNEFHKKYSRFSFDKSSKILRCYLRTNPKCIFFDEKSACTVYEARPSRCILFPVGRMFNQDNSIQYYLPKEKCIGFESKQKYTIQEWLDTCSIKERNELIKDWNAFVIKLKNSNLPLDDQFFIMFFTKIFYDFDNDLAEVSDDTREMNKTLAKDDINSRMRLAYKLSEVYLDHLNDWKEVYKRMDEHFKENHNSGTNAPE